MALASSSCSGLAVNRNSMSIMHESITALTSIVEHRLFQRYQKTALGPTRPTIMQMMERNPHAAMVLLVASVQYECERKGVCKASLELTDGWDSITVQCDEVLTAAVQRKKIVPGIKIRSRLQHSPLLLASDCTSIVAPCTKLGPHPTRVRYLPLSRISLGVRTSGKSPAFGRGTTFLVVVLRRYPVLYWNRLPSGIYVFQTRRAFIACQKSIQEQVYAETEAAGSQARAEEVVRCTEVLKQQSGHGVANKIETLYAAMVTGQDSAEVLTEGLTEEETKQLEEYAAARRLEVESHVARTVEERCGVSLSRRPPGGRHAVMEARSYLVNEVLHASLPSGAALARGEGHPGRAVITVWRPYVASEEESTPVEEELEQYTDNTYQMKEGGVYAISGLDLSPRSYVNQWVRDEYIADALRTTNLRPVLPDTLLHLHGHLHGFGDASHAKGKTERMKIVQVATSVASLPPRVLIARAMPRATPGLDGMPAIASAFTWVQNSSCDQNVFDFTGILIRAGPIHYQPMNRLYPHYQWAFLADPNCESNNAIASNGDEHGRPWMLAVRLQGTLDAIDWFEPSTPSAWVALKDLECMARDDTFKAWQALGGQHSVVKVNYSDKPMPEPIRRLVSTLTPAAESLLGS